MRLRGRGSGFLEGSNNVESEDLLNLCVTGKNEFVLQMIGEEVENLLLRITTEYKEYYYRIHKKQCEGLAYRKYELKKNGFEMVKQLKLEEIN